MTHDDIPTHDCYGTDLRRVSRLLANQFPVELIAEALGISIPRARYAVIVATGDREGAPAPDELAALLAEIQAGWTPEQAAAAARGEARFSSTAISRRRPTLCSPAAREALERRTARRVEEGQFPIYTRRLVDGSLRYEARVEIYHDGRRSCEQRTFCTRDEAAAWGREWLRTEWARRHDGSCCGI